MALAGQAAGLDLSGYTSQAHPLMNSGLLKMLQGADARAVANAQKLLTEHEMGELFKVLGFAHGLTADFDALAHLARARVLCAAGEFGGVECVGGVGGVVDLNHLGRMTGAHEAMRAGRGAACP